MPTADFWYLRDGKIETFNCYVQEHDQCVAAACPEVVAPITVEADLWGCVSAASTNPERSPAPGTETRLSNFSDLVATATPTPRGSPSSPPHAAVSSRQRTRLAGGSSATSTMATQQRLVSLGLAVRAVEANLPPEREDLRDELSGVAQGLADAVKDLQEISRGIHPCDPLQGRSRSGVADARSPFPECCQLGHHDGRAAR